ncbi:phage tail tape measure protein [Pigmentiphaga kullae]|uniref:Lambda family phage tail tape measure protein n=1 Tax=Pigmentiphaga kullae TaxID=151784 RepID=A0A4Q7NCG0_9BURK|nr:phage tail tape measure protein [Pigmentiphaga kullae]RZS80656.1 lambda family phage tail tape measure protein [Pigmentiphaga kullae]
MADEVVGKATLQVDANTSRASAGLKGLKADAREAGEQVVSSGRRSRQSLEGMGDAAVAAYRKAQASNARWVKNAQELAATYGKTRAELVEFQAIQRGLSPEVYTPIVNKIKEAEKATVGLGMSAKATAAALRGVPAQFTDIVTQLAGGSNPLLVLTQQGGQLKDMFGGIAPAARALGSYVLGLVNPFTLAAAAAGALAFAYYQGSKEAEGYNRALVLTGNAAGTTADRMASMARRIADVQGTQGSAAAALTALANTARVGGENLERFALVAVRANKTIGQTFEETAKIFAQLGDEPVRASLKLNETLGYLTLSTYQQIRAAEEQGRKADAAALAQNAYANAMEQRMRTLTSQAGFVERGWDAITGAAKRAWDAMLNVGRPGAAEDVYAKAAEIQGKLDKLLAGGFVETANGAVVGAGSARAKQVRKVLEDQLKGLQPELERIEAEQTAAAWSASQRLVNQQRIAAQQRLDEQRKATRSRADQRKEEIEQLKRDAETVGMASEEYNRRVAAINEKYKDEKAPEVRDNAATRMLQQLREQEASLRAQLATADKIGEARKAQASFEQLIGDLKEKKILTADQRSLLNSAELIKAQLQRNVAVEVEVQAQEAARKAEEKRLRALEQYNQRYMQLQASIASANEARADQYQREIDAFGQGDLAYQREQATNAIFREFKRYRDQLAKSTPIDMLGSDDYKARLENLKAELDAALQMQRDHYAKLDQLNTDWTLGARRAFANYQESAKNVAASTQAVFSTAFQGLEDVFVKFATTGKLSFTNLVNSMLADLARLAARSAITGPLLNALGGLFGGGGLSGLFGGAGLAGVSSGLGLTAGGGLGLTAGGGLGLTLGGPRADGGPVYANRLHPVNERGIPELLSLKGKQYLMMGPDDGEVTPLVARRRGGDEPSNMRIVINNHGTPQQYQVERLTRDEVVLITRDEIDKRTPHVMADQASRLDSRFNTSIQRSFKLEPIR